ncbi:MAG: ABC transporter substrate-binding protein [Syntrophobacteraceae bacterium]
MKGKKWFGSILLALVLLSGIPGWALADNGSIVIAPAADAKTLNPLKASDSYSLYTVYLIYDPLFTIDQDLRPKPVLVTKVENPDDKTYVLHLRNDVKFHDGTPLTANDVKFTYDFIRDKNNGNRYASYYDLVDKIEVVDAHTVKFVTKEPYAPLVANLNLCIAPKHIAEKDPAALDAKPVGSGPYKFVEWTPQDKLVLTANPNYWVPGVPKIKDVTLKVIGEATTRLVALETGTVDIADHIPPAKTKDLTEKGLKIIPTQPNGYNMLTFNQTKKPFDDKRVREAMTLALNRAEIVQFVWYGQNRLLNSPIIPESWAYEPNVKNYGQDIERAKKLLAEAGYSNGFEFQLSMEADENVKKFVEIANQQWARIGLKGKMVAKEWGAYFNDITTGKYEVCAWQSLDQKDPDVPLYRMFHSKNWAPNGYNWIFFKNAKMDEILTAARTTLDQEKRKELYKEAQRLLSDEFVCIFLAEYKKFIGTSANVRDFYYSPYDFLRPLATATIEGK